MISLCHGQSGRGEAYDATHVYGATTLLLTVLRGSDLVAATLGDCALLVARPRARAP